MMKQTEKKISPGQLKVGPPASGILICNSKGDVLEYTSRAELLLGNIPPQMDDLFPHSPERELFNKQLDDHHLAVQLIHPTEGKTLLLQGIRSAGLTVLTIEALDNQPGGNGETTSPLRKLMEDFPEMFIEFSPKGHIGYCNPVVYQKLGISGAQAELTLDKLFTEKSRQIMHSGIIDLEKGQTLVPSELELEMKQSNGNILSVLAHSLWLSDGEADNKKIATILFDLSVQKMNEQRIDMIRNKINVLARTAMHFIRLNNTDEVFAYLEKIMTPLLSGYVPVYLKVDQKTKTYHVHSVPGISPVIMKKINHELGEDIYKKEFNLTRDIRNLLSNNRILKHKDGWKSITQNSLPTALAHWLGNELSIAEVYSAGIVHHGSIYGGIHFLQQKGAALPERELIEPLLHQTGIVLQQLTLNENLRVAKQQAEKAMREKAEFMSIMGHEIRTPLTSVIGLTDLLLDEHPQKSQLKNLHTLKFSAENLLFLINDLLDFNKIEAGKIKLEKTIVNLPGLIKDLISAFGPAVSPKNVKLISELDNDVPQWIKGDKTRLTQVLSNLTSNAVKFTNKGSIHISVSTQKQTEHKAYLHFSVSDTGIGIPENKQKEIFKLYTQADLSTSRNYGGTGLGLTISKRLVELMGGEISVKSKPGEGSTFFFTLKMEKAPPELIAQNTIRQPSAPPKEVIDFSDKRILMVEDNDINYYLTTQLFKRWNLIIDRAENGQLALKKISEHAYDLILMDIQMPEMDGLEATLHIRKLPDTKVQKIPIIALSAASMDETRRKAQSVGMNDFMTKPINPAELYAKLVRFLR